MKVFKKLSALVLVLCMILTSIALPAFADGESIIGDANIYRAPIGKVQKIEYSLVGSNSEKISDVEWSVSEYEGVSIDENGVLSVDGAVEAGNITITAIKDSISIAEKTITILAKPEKYSDLFDRYYEDFEVYKDVDKIEVILGKRPSLKYAAQYGTTLETGKEENGNTYAKATGAYYWGTLATFELNTSYNDGQPMYMSDASVVTLEGRFMVENATAAEQALMFYDNAGLKLMYKAASDPTKANVYDFATNSNAVLATVDVGEWFDLRVEFDHIASTYDVYLNNIRIIEGNTLNNNLYLGAGGRANALFIGASVDDMAMYNGRSANAIITGSIIGDANIYRAPIGKVQKIEYSLVGSNSEKISDVEWSVSEYEGVSIDENGVLSVDGAVEAGNITITAIKDSISIAEKTITILAKPEKYSDLFDRYYEDFEVYKDVDKIEVISGKRPSLKYAAQAGTTLETGKEENGNTYAKATGAYYWGTLATFELNTSYNDGQPMYMSDASVVTLEGRFMVENATAAEQALMFYDNAGLKLMYKAASDSTKANVYDFATNSNVVLATVDVGEWFDLRVEFDHIASTYDVYLNNIRIIEGNTLNNNLYLGAGGRANALFIGASVDDLAMYNGRSADEFETISITGDGTIYRAPVGTTQKLVYKADSELSQGTKWSLKNAPAGVTIDQNGVVRVQGSADAGTFEVQLVNSGLVVGSKVVIIPAQPEQYADAPISGRFFEDFTRYKDAVIETKNGTRGEIKLQSTGLVATTDETGNVYAKASISDGASWSASATALKLVNSYNAGNVYLADASNVVIEGKFMAEEPTNGNRWPMMWHNASGINISYEYKEGDTYAKIVYTDDSIPAGEEGNDNATIVANVLANKWFDLRIELDYEKYTYSVFVDGCCVISDKALKDKIRINKDLVIAVSVDDLAMYSGTKDEAFAGENMTIIRNGEVVDNATRRFDFASDGEFNLIINKTLKGTTDTAKLISVFAAVYSSDGCLKDCVYDTNLIMKDIIGSFLVELNREVKAGDYAKIFIWDMGSLKPLE